MTFSEIRTAFTEREKISDEWDYGVQQCHKKEIDLLTRDLNETIKYLENDCTADDFLWISEIFDELLETTQSVDLFNMFKKLLYKYPNETKKYYIDRALDFAEGALKDS